MGLRAFVMRLDIQFFQLIFPFQGAQVNAKAEDADSDDGGADSADKTVPGGSPSGCRPRPG